MRTAAILLALAATAAAAPKNVPAFRASPPIADMPDDTQPLVKSAIVLMQKGDLTGAKKSLDEVLKVTPQHALALLNLGIVEYRRKHFHEAEGLLQRAVRSNPDLAQGWMILGVVRQDQGKLDAALAALAQAVFLDPKNARAHHYLGVTIGRKGWYSGAEDEMRKAIELQPDYAEAHFNLAVFYLQRQPPAVELARRHYQKALDLGAAPDAEVARSIGG